MERFRKTNLSAFLNFLRAKYESYTGVVDVRSHPYYVMVDPTDVCQLRCPTCPTGIENEGRRQRNREDTTYRTDRSMMTPELFDALFEEMSEHLFLMELHGWGEPLLNPHFSRFVRKAKAADLEVRTHTNLSLALSDEKIDDLVSCGLDFLIASVDGFSQDAYERFRVGGNVTLVKQNMERLARARDRLGVDTIIVYKFLIFSWNEHELAAARQFADDLGIAFQPQDASVSAASWLPSHRKDERPFLSDTHVKDLTRQWNDAGKPEYWKEHEKHPYWIPVEPGNLWIPIRGPEGASYCGWHYGTAVIQPGGHVAPCAITPKAADRFGQVIPGKVRFGDVWRNDRYRKSRAAVAEREVEGLEATDTVCMRCYFPDSFKHVYSQNDGKVINQFLEVFRGSDAVLDQAFQLLSRGESADNRRQFTEFVEGHLTSYF